MIGGGAGAPGPHWTPGSGGGAAISSGDAVIRPVPATGVTPGLSAPRPNAPDSYPGDRPWHGPVHLIQGPHPVPQLLDIPVNRIEPRWHHHLGLVATGIAIGVLAGLAAYGLWPR